MKFQKKNLLKAGIYNQLMKGKSKLKFRKSFLSMINPLKPNEWLYKIYTLISTKKLKSVKI